MLQFPSVFYSNSPPLLQSICNGWPDRRLTSMFLVWEVVRPTTRIQSKSTTTNSTWKHVEPSGTRVSTLLTSCRSLVQEGGNSLENNSVSYVADCVFHPIGRVWYEIHKYLRNSEIAPATRRSFPQRAARHRQSHLSPTEVALEVGTDTTRSFTIYRT